MLFTRVDRPLTRLPGLQSEVIAKASVQWVMAVLLEQVGLKEIKRAYLPSFEMNHTAKLLRNVAQQLNQQKDSFEIHQTRLIEPGRTDYDHAAPGTKQVRRRVPVCTDDNLEKSQASFSKRELKIDVKYTRSKLSTRATSASALRSLLSSTFRSILQKLDLPLTQSDPKGDYLRSQLQARHQESLKERESKKLRVQQLEQQKQKQVAARNIKEQNYTYDFRGNIVLVEKREAKRQPKPVKLGYSIEAVRNLQQEYRKAEVVQAKLKKYEMEMLPPFESQPQHMFFKEVARSVQPGTGCRVQRDRKQS